MIHVINLQQILCSSRKYLYLPHRRDFFKGPFPPPPPPPLEITIKLHMFLYTFWSYSTPYPAGSFFGTAHCWLFFVNWNDLNHAVLSPLKLCCIAIYYHYIQNQEPVRAWLGARSYSKRIHFILETNYTCYQK